MVALSAAGALPVSIDLSIVWATIAYVLFGGQEPYEGEKHKYKHHHYLGDAVEESDYYYYYQVQQYQHEDDDDDDDEGYRSLNWRENDMGVYTNGTQTSKVSGAINK
ncbi:hypothetical protein Pcinc_009980 [Petrolisthes cinctipes]|uniref:Uncharacterized protein n=1 Tax=Petrolisthes cinctipes TaxID=88211 RepID=A0AAE1G3Q4_PETCI|nr:hypothetical protein Pcinc_009980 [Petrolisthes cinctipes]